MDKYLESLVLKESEVEQPIVQVANDDVATDNTLAAVSAEELAADADIEMTEPAADVEQEPASDVEEEVEPVEEKKTDSKCTEEAQNTFVAVSDIKMFNSPDPKGPFKIFTGNVLVEQKVGDMTQVSYMKPGFGLVKGFTPDLA